MIEQMTEFIAYSFGGIAVTVAGGAFVGLVVLALIGSVARIVRRSIQ